MGTRWEVECRFSIVAFPYDFNAYTGSGLQLIHFITYCRQNTQVMKYSNGRYQLLVIDDNRIIAKSVVLEYKIVLHISCCLQPFKTVHHLTRWMNLFGYAIINRRFVK